MIAYHVKVYGNASVAQYVLRTGDEGSFLSINLTWGMAVTMGVYWAGSISGTFTYHENLKIVLYKFLEINFNSEKGLRSFLMQTIDHSFGKL